MSKRVSTKGSKGALRAACKAFMELDVSKYEGAIISTRQIAELLGYNSSKKRYIYSILMCMRAAGVLLDDGKGKTSVRSFYWSNLVTIFPAGSSWPLVKIRLKKVDIKSVLMNVVWSLCMRYVGYTGKHQYPYQIIAALPNCSPRRVYDALCLLQGLNIWEYSAGDGYRPRRVVSLLVPPTSPATRKSRGSARTTRSRAKILEQEPAIAVEEVEEEYDDPDVSDPWTSDSLSELVDSPIQLPVRKQLFEADPVMQALFPVDLPPLVFPDSPVPPLV